MKQDRLNAFAVLTVELEIAINVNADVVIDNFKLPLNFKRRMT